MEDGHYVSVQHPARWAVISAEASSCCSGTSGTRGSIVPLNVALDKSFYLSLPVCKMGIISALNHCRGCDMKNNYAKYFEMRGAIDYDLICLKKPQKPGSYILFKMEGSFKSQSVL